jgi:uncharacterized delta-60 repeat protein
MKGKYGALGALLLLALAFPAALLAQLDQAWVADYNGPYSTAEDGAYRIALDAAGNVYVTGWSNTGTNGYDFNTVKYDAAGNELWGARYDGPGHGADVPCGIAVDDAGNVYVTGNSCGSGTDEDYATLKYDAGGNVLWTARYDGPGPVQDHAYGIAVDASGNVYVAGYSATIKYDTDGNELWVSRLPSIHYAITVDALGNSYVCGYDHRDYGTIKFSPQGETLWTRRYNGPGNDYDFAQAIAVDASGNVFVTGYSRGSGTGYDYATVKYDANGTEQWATRYAGSFWDDYAIGVAVDASGSVYVTGYSPTSVYSEDYTTVKYGANGVEQWVRRYNGPGNEGDYARAIELDAAGNVYVTGGSNADQAPGSDEDYATVKYDASGTEQWIARYNGLAGGGRDGATAIAVDLSGNVFVTGASAFGANNDYATVKYSSSGVEQWVARYNYPFASEDGGRAVAMDAAGNIYVTGYSTDDQGYSGGATFKYGPSGNQLWLARSDAGSSPEALAVDATGNVYVTEDGAGDYVTVKYSSSGVAQWLATYNGPANGKDVVKGITIDASGSVYVTGTSYGGGSDTNYDYATVKYDASGVEQWAARYDGPANDMDEPSAIAVDASGNVYVTGYSIIRGSAMTPGDCDSAYATVMYNSRGVEQWVALYSVPDAGMGDVANAIALDASGMVYVTGGSFCWGTGYDCTTIKYEPKGGTQKWVSRYSGPAPGWGYDAASAIAVDASGYVYVTGRSSGPNNVYDYATVKYDVRDGTQQWVARYDGPGSGYYDADEARAIAVDASGNVFVTGYSMGSGTGYDYATLQYDANGNQIACARYNGPLNGDDRAHSVAVSASGDVCVTGYSAVAGQKTNIVTVMYRSAAPWGWSAGESLPTAPSGEFEGTGGWLAYDGGSGLVYAAKGNNTGDFYAYSPVTNIWEERPSIPGYGSKKPVLPGTGCRGVSDGNGTIYMALGNWTPGFLRYTATEGWTWLVDVPALVAKGSDLAYVNGSVYLLNGNDTRLYRYDGTAWTDLGPLPEADRTGWKNEGSWLVFDGDHTLYAQQAQTDKLWAYDLSAMPPTWTLLQGMPPTGTSYTGEGGAGVLLDGVIHALKGNNTTEFWQCVPGVSPAWTRLGDVPVIVKAGGDICATQNRLFAFSGRLTNQFWRYVRPTGGSFGGGAGAGTALLPTEFALSVSPNPMKLGTAIRYSVPAATNVSLKLYDITGALAKTVCNGRVQPGRYTANLSANGLARGVYILKLQSDACSLTRKVVIE